MAGKRTKAKAPAKRKAKAKTEQKAAEPAKLGRPTLYSAELAEVICAHIIEGKTLRVIGELEGMPARQTIIRWLAEKEDFRVHYVRAREIQALIDEDNLTDIADDASEDYREVTENGKKKLVFNKQHVERSKLRVETRKWLMSRRQPKRYGDKLDLNHGGSVAITDTMQQARDRLAEFRKKQQAEAKERLAAQKPAVDTKPKPWVDNPK